MPANDDPSGTRDILLRQMLVNLDDRMVRAATE
jgi:hypothetical protein